MDTDICVVSELIFTVKEFTFPPSPIRHFDGINESRFTQGKDNCIQREPHRTNPYWTEPHSTTHLDKTPLYSLFLIDFYMTEMTNILLTLLLMPPNKVFNARQFILTGLLL